MSFLSPWGIAASPSPCPHPSTALLTQGGGVEVAPDSEWIGKGAYRRLRALAVRPGSLDGPRARRSSGARGEGRREHGKAPSTRPPRARPGRGPERRRPLAPSRGRGALPSGSAAGDCFARIPALQNCGLVSESPCPGDLGKPRAGEPRRDWPSLTPPRGCYSGRRAQGLGIFENRGRPVPGVRGAAPSPLTSRSRPREGLLSQPLSPSLVLPSGSACSETRGPEFRSWGFRFRSQPPQAQDPQRTGETLSPRSWA